MWVILQPFSFVDLESSLSPRLKMKSLPGEVSETVKMMAQMAERQHSEDGPHIFGQFITTSAEVTPNGGLVRESPPKWP